MTINRLSRPCGRYQEQWISSQSCRAERYAQTAHILPTYAVDSTGRRPNPASFTAAASIPSLNFHLILLSYILFPLWYLFPVFAAWTPVWELHLLLDALSTRHIACLLIVRRSFTLLNESRIGCKTSLRRCHATVYKDHSIL